MFSAIVLRAAGGVSTRRYGCGRTPLQPGGRPPGAGGIGGRGEKTDPVNWPSGRAVIPICPVVCYLFATSIPRCHAPSAPIPFTGC